MSISPVTSQSYFPVQFNTQPTTNAASTHELRRYVE